MNKKIIAILIVGITAVGLAVGTTYYFSNYTGKGSNVSKDVKIEETEKVEESVELEPVDEENIDVVISDKNFVTELNDVFANLSNYIGKSIKVEGIAMNVEDNSFSVVRLYDSEHEDHVHEVTVGINAKYDGLVPKEENWVTIIGRITSNQVNGRIQPVVVVEKLDEKTSWGQQKVYN